MERDNRGILIVLGVLLLIVLLGPLLMGGMIGAGWMGPGMMGGFGRPGAPPNGWGWGWGAMMGLGWLMMLAFWGSVILGIALLVRWLGGMGGGRTAEPDSALEVLRRRYAAGEISHEEFDRMRQALER